MEPAYVPPWLQYSPSVTAENMRTGIDAAGRNADRREQKDEATRSSFLEMGRMAQQVQQFKAEKQQQQQQFQTKTALDVAQLAIDKQEKDRQFALQQATQAQAIALKKQQLDLETQAAARSLQWRQRFQQLTAPSNPTSADVAGADIAGAPAPTSNAGLSPYEAFTQLGPPPDESMAGYGASLRAMAPTRIPAPPSVVTDPASKNQAWYYNNKLTPIKPPADLSAKTSAMEDKSTEAERKDKITFVNNFLKSDQNATVDDANKAWKKLFDEDEGGESSEAPGPSSSPATSRYQILQVQ